MLARNPSQHRAGGTGKAGLTPYLPSWFNPSWRERHLSAMIANLRNLVLAPPANCERFHVIFLDDHKCFQGSAEVAVGGQAALSFSLRELFQRALTAQARGMILAHNHPSGDCRPSLRDIEGTQKISTVAKPLGIEIVDHLIFSEVSVYSMRKGEEL